MGMKIPASFLLHGQKINVILEDHIGAENGTLGEARLATNTIAIQSNANGYTRIQSQLEETYIHELVHFILHHMGQNELNEEETFVDGFAQLLHQAMVTSDYSPIKKVTKGGKKRG